MFVLIKSLIKSAVIHKDCDFKCFSSDIFIKFDDKLFSSVCYPQKMWTTKHVIVK